MKIRTHGAIETLRGLGRPVFISWDFSMTEQPKKRRQFRSLPLRESPVRVDREGKAIFGVSVAQAVEALGHGMLLDQTSIDQIVTLGNAAAPKGVKSRFTHPGMSSDGAGSLLGRLRNFRAEGDKAVADLHLTDSSFASPKGNIGGYVLDLAESDPDMFGMSVVIDLESVWPLADGREVAAMALDDDGYPTDIEKPDNALTDLPVARVTALYAADVVDEPAANRDGLFSARLWGTNQLSEEMFAEIDRVLEQAGFGPEKAFEFALKYGAARGVNLKEFAMSKQQGEGQPVTESVSVAQFDKLQAQFAELQERLAAEAAEKAEAKERAEKLEAALDGANERIANMETAARQARFRALASEWAGDTNRHVSLLESLSEHGGEDGEAFRFYVEQQDAVAAQLAESSLFEEVGESRTESAGAYDRVMSEARKLMAEGKAKSLADAVSAVVSADPALYEAYRQEGN